LQIFCDGKNDLFEALQLPAKKLGSAFQKVNFLIDLRADMNELGRCYFPEIKSNTFNEETKELIEQSIQSDFVEARKGLKNLPGKSKLAVSLAFFYYQALFEKIKRKTPLQVLSARIRISGLRKQMIWIRTYFMFCLGRI
jgi:phytoene/squalene synthetase